MEQEPKKRKTPVKAIRAKCLDCSNGSQKEVRECPDEECPLYDYRMGKNPNYKKGSRKGNPNLGKQAKKYWAEKKAKEKANARKN